MSSLKAKHLARLREPLARLREQMRRLEKPALAGRAVVEFGDPAIDDELPGGGLAGGCLHEFVAASDDAAPCGLAAWLLGRAMKNTGVALWCRPQRKMRQTIPYGPGLARFGLATDRLLFARTRTPVETLWAMEEALRSGRFAAVLGEGVAPDLTATRRLQIAAEAGGSLALLLVPPAPGKSSSDKAGKTVKRASGRLSAATTRWRVAAHPAAAPEAPCWTLILERCRGGGQGAWTLEWNHEALHLRVAAVLGDRALAAAV
jgi:protein ImuA